jgi:hypothetical protein
MIILLDTEKNILYLFLFRMLWRFYSADVNISNGAETLEEVKGHTIAEDTFERSKVRTEVLNLE